MNGILNWPYFRSRAMVVLFGWIIVMMWNAIRTQFCQGRVKRGVEKYERQKVLRLLRLPL